MDSQAIPTVVLLIETSRGYGRGLLRGVIRWRQLHGPCRLIVSTGHFAKKIPKLNKKQHSGLIATVTSIEMCRAIKRLGIPTIITEPTFTSIAKPCATLKAGKIAADHEAIVTMACDYFLDNGFAHLAFCGIPGGWWSKKREDLFIRYLNGKSIEPLVYPCLYRPLKEYSWDRDSKSLAKWLRDLPKPVAILACNDDRGRHLIQVCNTEGIDVPEEVSVLGIDNDDLECELTQPTLSSISLDVSKTGFEAMKALMESVRRPETPPRTILDMPSHITERQSVNIDYSCDETVSKALKYIRDNFLLQIQVDDVTRFAGVSRRSLERSFARQLNKTIFEEIQSKKFERAKQLLANTTDPVAKIALASGFVYLQPMLKLFRDRLGCTPTEYRRENRPAFFSEDAERLS